MSRLAGRLLIYLGKVGSRMDHCWVLWAIHFLETYVGVLDTPGLDLFGRSLLQTHQHGGFRRSFPSKHQPPARNAMRVFFGVFRAALGPRLW
jgi:hypothetical protein